MARTYISEELPASDDPIKLFDAWDQGMRWDLFERRSKSDGEWKALKLSAAGPVESKASYWFGWNMYTERFAVVKDSVLLKKYRPRLYACVERILRERSTPRWRLELLSPDLRARLKQLGLL